MCKFSQLPSDLKAFVLDAYLGIKLWFCSFMVSLQRVMARIAGGRQRELI